MAHFKIAVLFLRRMLCERLKFESKQEAASSCQIESLTQKILISFLDSIIKTVILQVIELMVNRLDLLRKLAQYTWLFTVTGF